MTRFPGELFLCVFDRVGLTECLFDIRQGISTFQLYNVRSPIIYSFRSESLFHLINLCSYLLALFFVIIIILCSLLLHVKKNVGLLTIEQYPQGLSFNFVKSRALIGHNDNFWRRQNRLAATADGATSNHDVKIPALIEAAMRRREDGPIDTLKPMTFSFPGRIVNRFIKPDPAF